MKVFITFTEQKNFGSRRDVVSANGFGIVGNIAFNIFREKRKVIFTRLGLGKALMNPLMIFIKIIKLR